MSQIDELLKQPPYRTEPGQHAERFAGAMREAIVHHCGHCAPFDRWYRKKADPEAPIEDLSRIPFLPVSIFKKFALQSVGGESVVRTLKSSATSSQVPSSIVLDAVTRDRQTRALAMIMSETFGVKRRPFIVLDAAPAAGSDVEISARVAGMRGYLMMASEVHHVMRTGDAVPVLDVDRLRELLETFTAANQPVCLIGYTYMLYQYVVLPLLKAGVRIPLPAETQIIHFGGWKRLESSAVGRTQFNANVRLVFNLPRLPVRDVYGFTEQLGIVYPDDGEGVRLTPTYSEVLVRDPFTFKPVPDGQPGLLQFISPLPHSYPGIAVLLDDIGRIVSRDSHEGGRCGTRFEVLGRAKGAEIRGCGDTMPDRVYEVRV